MDDNSTVRGIMKRSVRFEKNSCYPKSTPKNRVLHIYKILVKIIPDLDVDHATGCFALSILLCVIHFQDFPIFSLWIKITKT